MVAGSVRPRAYGRRVSARGDPVDGARRTILHVDMDMFFVAVELRRRPELSGLPVVVGGVGDRGVVAAASYEARRFGVHSAMSSRTARRLCPSAVFLPGDLTRYAEVSREVFAVFHRFTPLVEGLSLDEAFLDVTGTSRIHGDGATVAAAVRRAVADATGLVCSVGVASCMFVAKLASRRAKPRGTAGGVIPGLGVVVVAPGEERQFVRAHPIEALWGVGPATVARLERMGIRSVDDLAAAGEEALAAGIGRASARHLAALADGRDDRAVVPDGEAQSIGNEETFARDVRDSADLRAHLLRLVDRSTHRCRSRGLSPRTVVLKVRYGDMETVSRSRTFDHAVTTVPAVMAVVESLLHDVDLGRGIRLIGVVLRTFDGVAPAAVLFEDGGEAVSDLESDWREATRAVDDIRARFGSGAIGPGRTVVDRRAPEASPWGPLG